MDDSKKSQNSEGFTIIEILISSALLVILAAGFLTMQYILSQNQVVVWRNYLNIEDGNSIVTNIIKEIRDASAGENGSYLLISAEDQEIIFYSDYDFDGIVERIRYTLNNTDLEKGVTEPSGDPPTYDLANESSSVLSEIVRNGSDPVFYYYNADWPTDTTNNPLSSNRVADTRVVEVNLRLNTKADDPNSEFLLESETYIRMLQ